jgi:16S rRNA (adenine1518-N6/adenine1519-N6)-dimethyltransferase
VIANVPYYITGAILRHLLTARHKPELMVLTVQKEVAARVTAVPPQMNLLAVNAQFHGAVKRHMTIKAGAFWPRPAVDSAVITLQLRDEPLLPYAEQRPFFRLVKAGFSQKRKQLHNNLRQLGIDKHKINVILEASGIEGRRRAETLSLTEWLHLYQNWPQKQK